MKNTGQLMDVNNEVVNDLSCVVKEQKFIYITIVTKITSYQSNHSYQSKLYAIRSINLNHVCLIIILYIIGINITDKS